MWKPDCVSLRPIGRNVSSAQGEDRSGYQSVASWAGLDFGIAKATEGLTFTDPTFAENWSNLAREVAFRGAYHYYHPADNPITQAEFFARTVADKGLRPGDQLWVDAEIEVGAAGQMVATAQAVGRSHLLAVDAAGLVVAREGAYRLPEGPLLTGTVDSGVKEFCDALVTLAPANPIVVYTYLSFAPNLVSCVKYPLAIADYSSSAPTDVTPWQSWTIWQWSGGGGMNGGDRDAFHGDLAAMRLWVSAYTGGGAPTPSPAPSPTPTPTPDPPAPPQTWQETLMTKLPILRIGMIDPEHGYWPVHRVQWLHNGFFPGSVIPADGNFGPRTEAAVRKLQQMYGIAEDGVVGPVTWSWLLTDSAP